MSRSKKTQGGLRAATALVLSTLVGAAQADTVYLSPEEFLHEVFVNPPPAQVLWLDRDAQTKVTGALGHPYPRARVRYWRADTKTVWILDEVGKEYPITAGFVVISGSIEHSRVLIYRETRGMEVRYPSFLQQFVGARLEGKRLSKSIDGISGATLSVAAMKRMARTALTLDQIAR